MYIGLCDDDLISLDTIEGIVSSVLSNNSIHHQIERFSSGEELLLHLRHIKKFDLLLLDVKMFQVDGLEVARQIRQSGSNAKIVFISSIVEAAPEGYKVEAFRYIIKDSNMHTELVQCLESVCAEMQAPAKVFEYTIGDQHYIVLVEDIVYFESQLRKVRMVHFDTSRNAKEAEFYALIQELEQRLEKSCFLRVHKGFLVNPEHITDLKRYEAIVTCGDSVPISAKRYNEVNTAFLRWKVAQYG